MATFDTTAWLGSVHAHLRQYPQIADTVGTVHGYRPALVVNGARVGADAWEALAAWARTMCDVEVVTVDPYADSTSGSAHAVMRGVLVDGTVAEVEAVLGELECHLIAANMPLADEGRTAVPVELLLQLTCAAAAEAVAR